MIKAWKELRRETVFKKYSHQIERIDFLLPNGIEANFYIKASSKAACTLALTANNQVVLVKQYRPGPNQILNELPGGWVDPGEEPAAAARREFIEETGYDGDFEFIGTCLDDAYSTMERHCFIAKNCHKIGEPQNTDTEETEVVLLSLSDFRTELRKGQMTDIEVGYLGLDYLGLL